LEIDRASLKDRPPAERTTRRGTLPEGALPTKDAALKDAMPDFSRAEATLIASSGIETS